MPAAPMDRATGPVSPLEFGNVRLLVHDFAASWYFYHDLLGLESTHRTAEGPYAEFLWKGEPRLGLFDARLMGEAVGLTGPPTMAAADVGRFALVFEVDDVDQSHRELLSKGATILTPPTDRPAWGLRTLHLRDPDGNVVELYGRPR